jgi:hypothetical protein
MKSLQLVVFTGFLCVASACGSESSDSTDATSSIEAPTTLQETSSSSSTTFLAPTTTVDVKESDAKLIRDLVYEQQQFSTKISRTDPTVDDWLAYSLFHAANSEPSFADAMFRACPNLEELDRQSWRQESREQRISRFDIWSVDVATLDLDEGWSTEVNGEVLGPFQGRTYLISGEFQSFSGTSVKQDVHFNVRDGRAYWFWGLSTFDGCEPV